MTTHPDAAMFEIGPEEPLELIGGFCRLCEEVLVRKADRHVCPCCHEPDCPHKMERERKKREKK